MWESLPFSKTGIEDTSSYTQIDRLPPTSVRNHEQRTDNGESKEKIDQLFVIEPEPVRKSVKARKRPKLPPLKYRAKQVIIRSGVTTLPTGTIASGILSSSIDTRETGALVRAFLPDGVRFDGQMRLPKLTLLLGNFSYEGRGKKVVVKFTQAIFSDGRELPVKAQAILEGERHSNRAGKTAMVLGLTMASGMADVLAQKQAVGHYGDVTVKSSMKNALYHGSAKALDTEAQRQEQEMGELAPYVTVKAGKTFSVTFTAPLKASLE